MYLLEIQRQEREVREGGKGVVRSLSLRIVTELTKVPNFAQLELTAEL